MRLNIILDIDETLLNAVTEDLLEQIPTKDEYQILDTDMIFKLILRPHLREFLDFLFETANVNLWTWSDKTYAEEVAFLITNGHPEQFKNIWSCEDVIESKKLNGYPKDLNYIWSKGLDPRNTIFFDDLDTNAHNPSNIKNGIVIPSFEPFGPRLDTIRKYKSKVKDKALLKAIKLIKKIQKTPELLPFKDPVKIAGESLKNPKKHPKN